MERIREKTEEKKCERRLREEREEMREGQARKKGERERN